MPRATVNGIDTHYEVRGSGAPVLFIHGGYGGATTSLLPPPAGGGAEFLAQYGRLITYDRRSAFRSQYVTDRYTLAEIAADARAMLDFLGIEQAIIVGSSAGGPVALEFTLTWPERVRALALPNTGPAIMSLTPYGESPDGSRMTAGVRARLKLVRERIADVEQADVDGDRAFFEPREAALRTFHPPQETPMPAERVAAMKQALEAVSSEDLFTYHSGQLRNWGAYVGVNHTPRLGEIEQPTFIVHGTADATVPIEYGRDLEAGIPGAVFHAIDGVGHGVTRDPEAQRLLGEWISQF